MGFFRKKKKSSLDISEGFEEIKKAKASNSQIKEFPLLSVEPYVVIAVVFAGFIYSLLRQNYFFGFIVVSAGLILLWAIKYFFFHPRGSKVIVIEATKNTGIRIRARKLQNDEIRLSKDENDPPVKITRANKHFDRDSGRPVVFAIEGVPENVSLVDKYNPTMAAKDLNSIVIAGSTISYMDGSRNVKGMPFFKNKQNILIMGVILVAVAITGFLVYKTFDAAMIQINMISEQTELIKSVLNALELVVSGA